MSLITKEVLATLAVSNIKYYENLDYGIPRRKDKWGEMTVPRGSKILVKVEDLSDGSSIKVDIECDCCKKILKNIVWHSYKKHVKENGEYYCLDCSKKIYGGEKSRKTKLNNGKSFKQWCIENNKQDLLDRWDYELNKYKPFEISFRTNKKIYFKCPKGLHKSELKNINSYINGTGDIDCNQCNSFTQWGIDNLGKDFLEKYWDYDKNIVDPWGISNSSRNKVWIKCQEKNYHGSYEVYCYKFTTQKQRCHYCCNFHGKVHILDSLGSLYSQSLVLWSGKNKKSPYEYSPHSNQKVWWKCPDKKHNDYSRIISGANSCNFRCPECVIEMNSSMLQQKVALYLESLSYNILHEYKCTIIPKNPKTKDRRGRMPFDNEIKELKLIIEVHGKQHYELNGLHYLSAKHNNTTPEYEFHYQKLKDRYKRIYAKSQGYKYLEISYLMDNRDETWKKLIDEKIGEIKMLNGLVI